MTVFFMTPEVTGDIGLIYVPNDFTPRDVIPFLEACFVSPVLFWSEDSGTHWNRGGGVALTWYIENVIELMDFFDPYNGPVNEHEAKLGVRMYNANSDGIGYATDVQVWDALPPGMGHYLYEMWKGSSNSEKDWRFLRHFKKELIVRGLFPGVGKQKPMPTRFVREPLL